MTTIARLDRFSGVAAFVCALVVFVGAALDGPDVVAVPAAAPAVGSAR